jgi:hypothetical protein
MNSDFRDLLRLFNARRDRYLVVGSYAVMKYIEPRYMKDRKRSRVDSEKRIDVETGRRSASAVEWLAGEAKAPDGKWRSHSGRSRGHRGTPSASGCLGR